MQTSVYHNTNTSTHCMSSFLTHVSVCNWIQVCLTVCQHWWAFMFLHIEEKTSQWGNILRINWCCLSCYKQSCWEKLRVFFRCRVLSYTWNDLVIFTCVVCLCVIMCLTSCECMLVCFILSQGNLGYGVTEVDIYCFILSCMKGRRVGTYIPVFVVSSLVGQRGQHVAERLCPFLTLLLLGHTRQPL